MKRNPLYRDDSDLDRAQYEAMRPSFDEDCELCNGTGKVHGDPGPGGVIASVDCDCGYSEP